MEGINELERRKVIVQGFEILEQSGKAAAVRHLQKFGFARSTIYRVLARHERGEGIERRKGSGSKAVKMDSKQRKKLVRAAVDRKGVTTSKLARKFGVDQSYVSKILKEENVKHFKRQKAPAGGPGVEERQRMRCRRLSRNFLPATGSRKLVMDDESFFPLKHDGMPGNQGYFTKDKENTPPDVRYTRKEKFPKKLLVWMALSEEGHSDVFFVPNGGSVNGQVYRDECITARLVPFLDELHPDGDYIFWPDLASAHYAKDTIALLQARNIHFVPKEANPPSTPQLRPVEDVWLWLKRAVYKDGWEAENFPQLKRRIRKCLCEMDWDPVRRLLQRVKTKIRKAADHGPLSVLH